MDRADGETVMRRGAVCRPWSNFDQQYFSGAMFRLTRHFLVTVTAKIDSSEDAKDLGRGTRG